MDKTEQEIRRVCESVTEVLLEKNKRYGNAALSPLRIFAKQSAESSILVRLDDKLNRIKNSEELRKNDVFDLIGYLTLLAVKEGWDFADLVD